MFNRIASHLEKPTNVRKPAPAVRIANERTIADPCGNLPAVYHTCGVRSIWLVKPNSIFVEPICPQCTAFKLTD